MRDMAKTTIENFSIKKKGDGFVYASGKKKSQPEITLMEDKAIDLLAIGEKIIRDFPEIFTNDRRLASLTIFPSHITVTITQFHGEEPEHLAHVWKEPNADEMNVFRT